MLPDRVSNPGPLTYESGALPIALRGPAVNECLWTYYNSDSGRIVACQRLAHNIKNFNVKL